MYFEMLRRRRDTEPGEKRVMKRLLQRDPCVLASGGGSFVAEQTRRQLAKLNAVTVWLKADVDVLYNRTAGRKHRPFHGRQ